MRRLWIAVIVSGTLWSGLVCGSAAEENWPIVFRDDFEQGAAHWKPLDPMQWRTEAVEGRGQVYSQFVKKGAYRPPHRSPVNIAICQAPEARVGDFELSVKVRSTHPDYGHRDVCIVFGHQDPAHFYYVHLGKKTDDHANQIFIVDGSPRTKISTKTTEGTNWDDAWHAVRILRTVSDGRIQVFFDEKLIMEAANAKFAAGTVGLGSFDDTSQWDDLVLRAK